MRSEFEVRISPGAVFFVVVMTIVLLGADIWYLLFNRSGDIRGGAFILGLGIFGYERARVSAGGVWVL